MELARRWGLFVCAALAIWTAKMASVKPLFVVRAVDFAELQKRESPWTDRGRYLAQLPIEEYAKMKVEGAVLSVPGESWTSFLKDALAASRGEIMSRSWTSRVPADERRWTFISRSLFFRPGEAPLDSVAGSFANDKATRYLAVEENGRQVYLSLSYQVYDPDDFEFGSGFDGLPKPPSRFLYPLRKFSLWFVGLGLALYLFLPRRKKNPEAVYYQTWRVILGDLMAMILFVSFFAIPIMVIGGSLQAITIAWPVTLVCWPLAFVGIWFIEIGARYASYQLLVTNDGVELSTHRQKRLFRFEEMSFYQPIVVNPPKWLIFISWLAVLASRGSARVGQAGRALMLGGTASNGIGLGLKNGSKAFFWVTDQMGTKALRNAQRLLKGLENAGIRQEESPKVIESVRMPVGEDARGRILKEGSGMVLAVLLILPLAFTVIAVFVMTYGPTYRLGKAAPSTKKTEEAVVEKTKASALTAPGVVWTAALESGENTRGEAVLRAAEGSFVVVGCSHSERELEGFDFFLAKVGADGKIVWTKTYGGEKEDFGRFICPSGDGGYYLVGDTRRAHDYLGGSTNVLVIKADAEGTKIWEKTWGADEQDEIPLAAAPAGKGGLKALVRVPNGVHVFEWDGEGTVVKDERHVLLSQFERIKDILAGAFAADGGFVLTGEERNQNAFLDLFLARYDAQGKPVWKQKSGGPGKESGRAVIPLADGGFAAVGSINLFDKDGEDVYVLRTDAQGEVEYEYAHGGLGDQSGRALIQRENGDLLIVGRTNDGSGPEGIYMMTIVRGKVEIEDRRFGGDPSGAAAVAVALAGDGGFVLLADRTLGGSPNVRLELLKMEK